MLNTTRSENADPDEGTALKAGVVKDSLALTSPLGKRVIAVRPYRRRLVYQHDIPSGSTHRASLCLRRVV